MSANKWTRNEKIGLAAVVVTLAACIAAIVNPEIRKFIGLKSSSASQSITEAGVADSGKGNKNQEQNPNAHRPDDPKQTNSNTKQAPIPEPPTGKSTPQPDHKPVDPTIKIEESNGFLFELKNPKTSGSDVVVTMMITNKKAERGLWLFEATIKDDNGDLHPVNSQTYRGSSEDRPLAYNDPIRAVFTFKGIAGYVKHIQTLNFHFQECRVLFRDLTVTD